MSTFRQKSTAVRALKTKDATAGSPDTNPVGNHVGEILRQAREARGQSLDMVADELMIRRFYLEALEQGSFKDLPERVYATGFVRNYATYIGADGNQLVEQFRREAYGTRGANYQVELTMPEPIVHSIVPGRSAIAAACVVLVLLVAGILYATRDHLASTSSIPAPPVSADVGVMPDNAPVADVTAIPAPQAAVPPPPATAAATTSAPVAEATPPIAAATGDIPAEPTVAEEPPPFASATTTPAAETKTETPAAAKAEGAVAAALPAPTSATALPTTSASAAAPAAQKGVVLEATQSAWVEVKDSSGNVLFTSILKQGQLLPLPEKALTITTGNAGGLRVVVDGAPMEPLGQVNEVKRNIKLDPTTLHQR